MTISGVEPAERSLSFVTWGLAALGLTAAMTAQIALRVDKVAAQQNAKMAEAAPPTVAGKPAATLSIRVTKQAADSLKIKGLVSTDDDHAALLGLVKASFPSADVNDRIKVVGGPKTDIKLGGISFALKALSYLESGSARIDENSVAFSGDTENAVVYSEFKAFIASPPTGILVREELVSPPAASVSWRAEVGDGKVKLSGTVADSSDKKELQNKVQKLFSGLEIQDETSIVAGASDTWLDAAMHSLQVLRLLDSGFVELADRKIQLHGQASDEAKLHTIDRMADDYPTGFSLDTKVSAPTARASMLSFPAALAVERPPLAETGAVVAVPETADPTAQ